MIAAVMANITEKRWVICAFLRQPESIGIENPKHRSDPDENGECKLRAYLPVRVFYGIIVNFLLGQQTHKNRDEGDTGYGDDNVNHGIQQGRRA